MDTFSNVGENANSPILWGNNHIIGKLATDRIHPSGEYGLRDLYAADLQSRQQKINIKTSVILYQNKTNVIKMYTNFQYSSP